MRFFRYISILFSISFILMVSLRDAVGQSILYLNQSKISLVNGSSIYVDGNLTVIGDSLIKNQGKVSITKNISFDVSDSISARILGDLSFVGDSNQSISSTHKMTFDSLIVDKNDTLIFNQRSDLKGALRLISGRVNILDNDINFGNTGLLLGENDTCYVMGGSGELKAFSNLIAPVDFNIGNLGAEITSLSLLGTTHVSRRHNSVELNGEQGINRIFKIKPENNSNILAVLKLYYLDNASTLNSIPEVDLVPYRGESGIWSFIPGVVDTSENSILIAGITQFSDWSAGFGSSTLPVEWLNFTAEITNNDEVKLDWSTAIEIDNDYFSVERSSDGYSFEEIGVLEGSGNSNEVNNYSFYDSEPLEYVSYYRIKQVDFNGDYDYSNIESVYFTTTSSIAIFPNPTFLDYFNVTGKKGNFSIELFTSTGQPVLHKKISLFESTDVVPIYINHLSPGVFTLKIIDEFGKSTSRKILKL